LALWEQYDADKSGTLDGKETLGLMRDIVDQSEKVAMADIDKQKAELLADKSGMGAMMLGVVSGMEAMMKKMIAVSRAKVTDEAAANLLKRFDNDGDGKVTKDEFLANANQLLFKDDPLMQGVSEEEAAKIEKEANEQYMQAALGGMMAALVGGMAVEGAAGAEGGAPGASGGDIACNVQ